MNIATERPGAVAAATGSGAGSPEPADARPAPVLRVRNMSVEFATEAGRVPAVRGLSYEVCPGEVLAIVGESGSGKSVSSLAVMRLLPGNAEVRADAIEFDGIDLQSLSAREMREVK